MALPRLALVTWPVVSKEQRLEIMNKVTEACNNFKDDLKGTFYPLDGMDKKTQ